MNRYQVQHAYTAVRDGVRFGPWTSGEEVELADADAQWINRDSPDTLTPAQPDKPATGDGEGEREKEDERAGAPEANRAHKGPAKRGKR